MIKLAPSILSADFSCLGDQVRRADRAGADYIHVDVMDGHFVDNITIGPLVVKALRKITDKPLDTHLMIAEPDKYLSRFAEAGSDIITFHVEASPDPAKTIRTLHGLGVKAGITLNPATPFSALEPVLAAIDWLLVMTVHPGFGAQAFMPDMVKKIERARELKEKHGYKYDIEVDGGVSEKTASLVSQAGANVLVAGNAVFGLGGDIEGNIAKLRATVQ
ncbi:MAG: ribulose-phosphate 3-epimerase [Fibrobacterota bacterium]